MIRVGIIGATGYTAEESLRLLLNHRHAKVTAATARDDKVGPVEAIFPSLRGRYDLRLEPLEPHALADKIDVALCCLPHGLSMSFVSGLLKHGVKVIDFSADYRLRDLAVYEKFYGTHTDRDNVANAAFGLPELFRDTIVGKRLVANPGCFPTGIALGLAPLLKNKLIRRDTIISNSVSGISGAGKKPQQKFHFPEMTENAFAYGVGGSHRHTPEINQITSDVAGEPVKVLFQPHVGPFARGILTTLYADPTQSVSTAQLQELYREFYRNEKFVRVLNEPATIGAVAHTNFCDLCPIVWGDGSRIVIYSAIDNLIKGASGQAIQNMNLICGIDEGEGLR
jgi:N-acetyl-gamma-glutamyl-phosphate reductase